MDIAESNVIPFPVKRRPLDNDRLKRSMARLLESVEEQKRVVASYKKTMHELKESVDTLGNSVVEYDKRVKELDVRPLRRKSQRLHQIMDDWEKNNAQKTH
jgi:phage-related tail protein